MISWYTAATPMTDPTHATECGPDGLRVVDLFDEDMGETKIQHLVLRFRDGGVPCSVYLKVGQPTHGFPATAGRIWRIRARFEEDGNKVGLGYGNIFGRKGASNIHAPDLFCHCAEADWDLADTARAIIVAGVLDSSLLNGDILALKVFDFTTEVAHGRQGAFLRAMCLALKHERTALRQAVLIADPTDVKTPTAESPTAHHLDFREAIQARLELCLSFHLGEILADPIGFRATEDICLAPRLLVPNRLRLLELEGQIARSRLSAKFIAERFEWLTRPQGSG
jgi:hypothetical protein